MLTVLLAKDLRRAWRNPLPWLIHLAVPLVITALIGLTFGPSQESGGLGRIQLAIVDEDDSVLTGFIRGALNQREMGEHLAVDFLKRDEALRRIQDNRLSAIVVIPAGFTRDYVSGQKRVALELIKNPAQSFHPAIAEESLQALVTILNALARNFRAELPEWEAAIDRSGGPDFQRIGSLFTRAGDKLQSARAYLFPPLIRYETEKRTEAAASGPAFNIFAYLLPGMAAMFLLFLADTAAKDLYREARFRTLERYRALREQLWILVGSKVLFTLVILAISGLILFGGGALIFRIRWQRPEGVAVLGLCYSFLAAGLMVLLAALSAKERLATVLNNLTAMALSLAGGCMFPPQQLPAFVREHLTPLLPTNWFVEGVRGLQFGGAAPDWAWASVKLAVLGLALIAAAAFLFQRRIERGIRQ
ncbi:MAG: ABC transporter permease [Verrucomicrobia bacterium]|nr:ABC transporter permease [Verrucomicrobiota bacterium]